MRLTAEGWATTFAALLVIALYMALHLRWHRRAVARGAALRERRSKEIHQAIADFTEACAIDAAKARRAHV